MTWENFSSIRVSTPLSMCSALCRTQPRICGSGPCHSHMPVSSEVLNLSLSSTQYWPCFTRGNSFFLFEMNFTITTMNSLISKSLGEWIVLHYIKVFGKWGVMKITSRTVHHIRLTVCNYEKIIYLHK
jgi:hypothetical protein